MSITLSDLTKKLGCDSLPERWEREYERLMAKYDSEGSPYVKREFYENLNKKYGMLEGLVDVYADAARAVGECEILSRILFILAEMQLPRSEFKAELRKIKFPKPSEDEPTLAYDMLPALTLATMADYCYNNLAPRGIPKEHIDRLMKTPEANVRSKVNRALPPRHDNFDWDQHSIDGKLYMVGALQIHVGDTLGGFVSVFENGEGERIALADYGIALDKSGFALGALYHDDAEDSFIGEVEETEKSYTGYPYTPLGTVKREKVTLQKSEWKKVLCRDDKVIKLHIPSGIKLTPEAVEDSLRRGSEFTKKYFPEFDYKAFCCYSWLCDPNLPDLLGEDRNISKFSRRFHPLTSASNGRSVFRFVYKNEKMAFDQIPEDTSLGRALKAHYARGGAIYDFRGYFFEDEI